MDKEPPVLARGDRVGKGRILVDGAEPTEEGDGRCGDDDDDPPHKRNVPIRSDLAIGI